MTRFTEADLARLQKKGRKVLSDSGPKRARSGRSAVPPSAVGFRNEEAFQKAACRHIDAVRNQRGESWLWTHVGNERKGDKARSRMGSFGTSPGVPDVMIFRRSGDWTGLAVELKHDGMHPSGPRIGDLTDSQQERLLGLAAEGWATDVCWTMGQFETTLDNYLNDPQSFIGGI